MRHADICSYAVVLRFEMRLAKSLLILQVHDIIFL